MPSIKGMCQWICAWAWIYFVWNFLNQNLSHYLSPKSLFTWVWIFNLVFDQCMLFTFWRNTCIIWQELVWQELIHELTWWESLILCLFSTVPSVWYADGGWWPKAPDFTRRAYLWCADTLPRHCLHLHQSAFTIWKQELSCPVLSLKHATLLWRWSHYSADETL